MTSKIVVTSGITFTDIDTLACAVAYAEILNKSNRPALAYLPGPLNQSIVSTIKTWNLNFSDHFDINDHPLIVVDVSEPDYLKNSLKISNVIEIYDHHFGFEKYWYDILGENSHIEAVGACATLIWEQAVKNKINLSTDSSNLLYTAVFSNTLNFNSSVSHDRDKQAFSEISKKTRLPQDWIGSYYLQLESESLSDPALAVTNDIKVVKTSRFSEPLFIGQLELWHSKIFIEANSKIIKSALLRKGSPYWFFTSPSISEGMNYIYCENSEIKKFLSNALGAKFIDNIGVTSKLFLRKEILKML